MNALCYKIVFSKRLGALVAVGEHTTGQGKAAGTGVRAGVFPEGADSVGHGASGNFVGLLKSVFASVALSCVTTGLATAAGPAANTLPTSYSVNSGNIAVSSTSNANNAAMTIKQSTDKASVNWQSFSIGSAASVNIQQNSANSVLLNRVVGNDPSQIFGKLTANGQVILINPNGIVFGKGGSVTASAFTASTFGMSEEDFKKGKQKYDRNGSTAGITVEEGAAINTTALGGYVALIGSTIKNQGTINTKQGAVVMAAGESVTLPSTLSDGVGIALSGKVRLELAPSTINDSIENGGTITTEGGQVLMQAAALADAVASVTHTGVIDTSGAQGGAVTLLAEGGQIKVTGNITANSTQANNKGGDIIIGRDEVTGKLAAMTDVSGAKFESKEGFIETSGHELEFKDVSVIAKNWLLDPQNVTIDATNVGTIGTNLGTTSITIQTTGTTLGTTSAGTGIITINNAITKATASGADTTLTLLADNGINVNAAIGTAAGAGKLNVVMIAYGQTDGVAVGSMTAAQRAASQGIFINNTFINANGGDVTLTGTSYATSTAQNNGVGKGVQIHNGSSITAKNITITGIAENVAGNTSYGVVFQRYPTAQTLNATGDINITGTLNGAGNGSGVLFHTSGWGAQAPMITAGGKFTLRANNRASTANTSTALDALSGMQVKALGDITVQAETNNAAANAMNFYSGAATVWGNALQGNTSFKSVDGTGAASGNVLIQANQGNIAFNNNITTTLTNGALTALTDIKGKNVTIDNTGAGMATGVGALVGSGGTTGAKIGDGSYTTNAATGEITVIKGTGKATSTSVQGVLINDGRSITADKNLNITGASSGNVGIQTGKGALSGGAVNIEGSSDTSIGVYMAGSGGTLSSTVGDVTITGTSASSAVASNTAVNLVNAISAYKNVSITGTNTNSTNTTAAVYVNAPITATLGTIDIKADTAGTSNQALNLNTPAVLTATAGQNITLTADSMNLASNINAGAGTVALKTKGAGVKIDMGNGTDVGSTTASSRTLGLSNAELNRITAGKTIIGDTTTGGNISVTAPVTTLDAAGSFYLKTAGNVSINSNLTVGNNGGKSLSIEATGTNSTIGGTGAVTANELKIKGSNATVAMAAVANQINTISADVKSLAFKNGKALSIGTVFAGTTDEQSGIKTTGVTSLTGTGSVTQTSAISADGLELLGSTTDFTLNTTTNAVKTIAANAKSVSYTNSQTLTVDQVNSTLGVTTTSATTLKTTQGDLTLKKNIAATNNTVSLYIAGSVLRDANATATDGIIKANALKIKANGIGASNNRVKTETSTLAMDTTGDQYVSEADGITLAAKTGGGKIDVQTINGTLEVGTVSDINGVDIQGITTTSSGDITLSGNSTSGARGVKVTSAVNGSGDIKITGQSNTGAGTVVSANVAGNQIVEINGTSNTTWGLGVENAAVISANGPINLTGTTGDGKDLGVLIWGGSTIQANAGAAYADGSNAISIRGLTPTNSTNGGRNVVINSNSKIINNSNNGDTFIYGQNSEVTFDAGTSITNAGTAGKIKVLADNNAWVNASNPSAKITQNSNKGISIVSNGNGDVLVPSIVNNGTGDVVIAAGSLKAAGGSTGGQVKTLAGTTITNDNGKTLIYSGSAADTGDLTSLMAGNNVGKLATLYLMNAGATAQNAAVNTAFGTQASTNAPAQVMFRENIQFDAKLNPTSLTKNFGEADPTTDAFKAALKAVNTSTESALTSITTTGSKQFKVGTAEFIDTLTGNLPGTAGPTRGAGTYNYTGTSSKTNIGVSSADVARSIAQLTVNSANITPVPAPSVNPSNSASVKIPTGSSNPFALASAEDLTDEACSANSLENCHCEESSVGQGIDICYEPRN